jgi:DNA mismatch repair ATPase MutS
MAIFSAIARVDVAISIDSMREGLPCFTKPAVESELSSVQLDDLYHPLFVDQVENSLQLIDGESVLMSGSNMSGKTTFIRTVGINCLLAQTINTACAKRLTMPPTRIFSAIRISDDLMDDTSYYYDEVRTIKQMISACDSDERNLFLLDEIFKGTNTIERIASGKAVLSFLGQGKILCWCLHMTLS